MVRNRAPCWRCILRPFCIRATTKVHVPCRSSGSSSSSYSCSRYWGLVQNVSAKHKDELWRRRHRAKTSRVKYGTAAATTQGEESTSHLGNSCNRQQSCLSPSGPGWPTPSSCSSLRPAERRASGYTAPTLWSCSWSFRKPSWEGRWAKTIVSSGSLGIGVVLRYFQWFLRQSWDPP